MLEKLDVILLSVRSNYRSVFGYKALLFLAGTMIYFAVFYIILWHQDEPLSLEQALSWLIWLPTTVFSVFFAMEIVSREQDAGVLETLFTVSVSLYRMWIIKFVVLMLFVMLFSLALIVATDVFIIDLYISLTLIYVMPPLVFFAALTVLLSVIFKSGNAAALCMAAVLGFTLLVGKGNVSDTVIFPYLNPFDKPFGTETFFWVRTVLFNKVAYLVIGCIWFWRTLRWLDRRERLLQ